MRLRSNELTKAGNGGDNLASRILPCFFSRIGQDNTRDMLHLAHGKPERHELRSRPHDAPHTEGGGRRTGVDLREVGNRTISLGGASDDAFI